MNNKILDSQFDFQKQKKSNSAVDVANDNSRLTLLNETIMMYAKVIAHDQRTPITCITLATHCYKRLIPILTDICERDKSIDKDIVEELIACTSILEQATTQMNEIIENALANINLAFQSYKGQDVQLNFTSCDIVNDNLNRENLNLVFASNDHKLVHMDLKNSFKYIGNKISVDQIITNILQNAFYQIRKNNCGEIFITTEDGIESNILRIRDTAGGATPYVVEKMFDASFTTKVDGNGVGLDFCKKTMQLFGGDITAYSEYGNYIEFVLTFPKV